MTKMDIHDAKHRLGELIAAAIRGEEVVITEHHRPTVKLVPVPGAKPRRQAGTAKGLITIGDDFDAELEDFKDYVP